jgi:hypothetical protein
VLELEQAVKSPFFGEDEFSPSLATQKRKPISTHSKDFCEQKNEPTLPDFKETFSEIDIFRQ